MGSTLILVKMIRSWSIDVHVSLRLSSSLIRITLVVHVNTTFSSKLLSFTPVFLWWQIRTSLWRWRGALQYRKGVINPQNQFPHVIKNFVLPHQIGYS